MANLANTSTACGYEEYLQKYLTYPPNGPLPLPEKALLDGDPNNWKDECAPYFDVLDVVYNSNPAFNVYKISEIWPILWVLPS